MTCRTSGPELLRHILIAGSHQLAWIVRVRHPAFQEAQPVRRFGLFSGQRRDLDDRFAGPSDHERLAGPQHVSNEPRQVHLGFVDVDDSHDRSS